MVKYKELIYDLNANGYGVYILDHRGQGFSQRELSDKQIGDIKNFYNYVDDLKFFVENYVPKNQKKVILAHSMGGAIASLYIEHYPHDFDAAILSSPMHQPGRIRSSLTNKICALLNNRESNFNTYAPTSTSFDRQDNSFKKNHLTHSKIRYQIYLDEYEKNPAVKIGGPSLRWVAEACKWSRISIEDAYKIKIPLLLLQAGKDTIVSLKAQKKFCTNVKSKCHLVRIPGAYHEMFIEKDKFRKKVLRQILDFLSSI